MVARNTNYVIISGVINVQVKELNKQMAIINAKLEEDLDESDRYFWEGMELYYQQLIWQMSFRGEQNGNNK